MDSVDISLPGSRKHELPMLDMIISLARMRFIDCTILSAVPSADGCMAEVPMCIMPKLWIMCSKSPHHSPLLSVVTTEGKEYLHTHAS